MSGVYEKILDNMVPKVQQDSEYTKSQQIREWLLEKVEERFLEDQQNAQPSIPNPGQNARNMEILTTPAPYDFRDQKYFDLTTGSGSRIPDETSRVYSSLG